MSENTTKLAEILLTLTYGELMEIAQQLADTVSGRKGDDNEFDPESAEEWAALLHGWADATTEAAHE